MKIQPKFKKNGYSSNTALEYINTNKPIYSLSTDLFPQQRFDHNTIPISVREKLNVLIQIGNINKKTTQFLYPDLDPEGIVIPIGTGTGLIQIIDNESPYQVLPLLCPTYYTKGGVF